MILNEWVGVVTKSPVFAVDVIKYLKLIENS